MSKEMPFDNKNIAKDLAKYRKKLQIQAMKLAKKREAERKRAAKAGQKYTQLVSNVAINKKPNKSMITYDSARS